MIFSYFLDAQDIIRAKDLLLFTSTVFLNIVMKTEKTTSRVVIPISNPRLFFADRQKLFDVLYFSKLEVYNDKRLTSEVGYLNSTAIKLPTWTTFLNYFANVQISLMDQRISDVSWYSYYQKDNSSDFLSIVIPSLKVITGAVFNPLSDVLIKVDVQYLIGSNQSNHLLIYVPHRGLLSKLRSQTSKAALNAVINSKELQEDLKLNSALFVLQFSQKLMT